MSGLDSKIPAAPVRRGFGPQRWRSRRHAATTSGEAATVGGCQSSHRRADCGRNAMVRGLLEFQA
jgi:hypothetical protein